MSIVPCACSTRRAGVQEPDGRAPLSGKRVQRFHAFALPAGPAHGQKRIANIVVDADLHVQNFFLADNVRHFLAQLPQRLVRRVQPRVFRVQLPPPVPSSARRHPTQ